MQFFAKALPDSPPLTLISNPIQPNPIMSSSFSPSRPPQQLIGVSRLRSSGVKKLPEPLRRAVADCLSSTLSPSNEPSRTLQVSLYSSSSLRDSCCTGCGKLENEFRTTPLLEIIFLLEIIIFEKLDVSYHFFFHFCYYVKIGSYLSSRLGKKVGSSRLFLRT